MPAVRSPGMMLYFGQTSPITLYLFLYWIQPLNDLYYIIYKIKYKHYKIHTCNMFKVVYTIELVKYHSNITIRIWYNQNLSLC